MDAFLLSFGVIFLAELGDKSQLMAMAFAARYRALTVLVAVTIATLIVHAGSVLLGRAFALALPTDAHPGRRGHRVLRLRGLDAPRRRARRGGRGPGAADGPLGAAHDRDRVLPRGARRQDDARDDHPRDDGGADRDLARLDRRHGRGGRDRDRHRRAPRRPAARSARSRSSPPARSWSSASLLVAEGLGSL